MAKMHPAAIRQPFHWRKSWPYIRPLLLGRGHRDRGWWWTPWTYRFGHGGWIRLNPAWLWRFRKGVSYEHMQNSGASRR